MEFQILHQETAGVLRDALHLWVASIQHIQAGKDLLTIRKPQTMPMQALRALPLESLLSLRQAVRQGYLAANDHAIQFQLNKTSSESELAQLAHWGLVEQDEEGHYRINKALEGCIYRILREKGVLG